MKYARYIIFLSVLLTAVPVTAEIPTVLTDTIKNGDGIIDIFKDVSSIDLQEYMQDGIFFWGPISMRTPRALNRVHPRASPSKKWSF